MTKINPKIIKIVVLVLSKKFLLNLVDYLFAGGCSTGFYSGYENYVDVASGSDISLIFFFNLNIL